jgi:AcrR family transcriptional regulator
MNVFAAPQPASSGNIKVTRSDWLNAALAILLSDGVENVRILSLAQKLDVSRSSFYWYFKDRQQLLDELLEHWRSTNTKAIVERANRRSDTIVRGVMNVFAIREWGRRSQPVREVVTRADEERLSAIRDMYIRHGYAEEDAFIRARVLYYMQIGYYVLEVHEPFDVRLSHLSAYLRSFTGEEPTAQDIQDFSNFVMRAKSA